MSTRQFRLMHIPGDWIEEDGYKTVLFCLPNSLEWRMAATALISQFAYGRAWDERTGNVKDVLEIGREVFESMAICDLETPLVGIDQKLERMIALLQGANYTGPGSLPATNDYRAEFQSNIRKMMLDLERLKNKVPDLYTVQQLLDDLDNSSLLEDAADLAEVLSFLKTLLPTINLNIPISQLLEGFATWRYRTSVVNLMEDITVSQRVQATAQFGTSGHSAYEMFSVVADKLLLPAGFFGRVVWLWNRVKPSEIPGWFSWVTDIASLFLGSMRGAQYDIAQAIRDNQDASQAGTFLCCFNDVTIVFNELMGDSSVLPIGPTWDGSTNNIPDGPGDVQWHGPVDSGQPRCDAAEFVYQWIFDFWDGFTISPTDNVLTAAIKVKDLLILLPPIGVTLATLSELIGRALNAAATGAIGALIASVQSNLFALHDEIVCALYLSDSKDEAIGRIQTILSEQSSLLPSELWTILALLQSDPIIAGAFWENDIIDFSTTTGDCSTCSAVDCSDDLASMIFFNPGIVNSKVINSSSSVSYNISSEPVPANQNAHNVTPVLKNEYFNLGCNFKVTSHSIIGESGSFINGYYDETGNFFGNVLEDIDDLLGLEIRGARYQQQPGLPYNLLITIEKWTP